MSYPYPRWLAELTSHLHPPDNGDRASVAPDAPRASPCGFDAAAVVAAHAVTREVLLRDQAFQAERLLDEFRLVHQRLDQISHRLSGPGLARRLRAALRVLVPRSRP
jgi:hypothetical protein